MIAFKADEFEQVLPEIRKEVHKSIAQSMGENAQYVLLSAEEYQRLRNRKIIRLDGEPPELLEDMARQLEEALDRREAAEQGA